MAGYKGIAYDDMIVGEVIGHYDAVISREDIERYFRNSGSSFQQNPGDGKLFVPPPMAYAITLRAIFHSNIPVDGPILVGHNLKCSRKIFEGEHVHVDVIIKLKYMKNDRKYISFDFNVMNGAREVCFVDSMRVIWPV